MDITTLGIVWGRRDRHFLEAEESQAVRWEDHLPLGDLHVFPCKELSGLYKIHMWNLVQLPHGNNAVSCRWIYKIKTKSDVFVDRYNTRLGARGFTQVYNIDYEETFAQVAKMISIHTLIVVTYVHQWSLS